MILALLSQGPKSSLARSIGLWIATVTIMLCLGNALPQFQDSNIESTGYLPLCSFLGLRKELIYMYGPNLAGLWILRPQSSSLVTFTQYCWGLSFLPPPWKTKYHQSELIMVELEKTRLQANLYDTWYLRRHYTDINQSDKQSLVAFYRLSTTDFSMGANSISQINSFSLKLFPK